MTAGRGSRVLMIGAGGLGAAAGLALCRSGVSHITVVDDDRVDVSNLHRQLLFDADAVGRPKAPLAAEHLATEAARHGHHMTTSARCERALPESALALCKGHDLIVEGADNYATKFMMADAARLAGLPIVHAGAVRWVGWAKASLTDGPCLRCVFEDIPRGQPDTCATAGVVGPVVGVLGALQAALALRVAAGEAEVDREVWNYRALPGQLRRRPMARNPTCPLCTGAITSMELSRYVPPECAA